MANAWIVKPLPMTVNAGSTSAAGYLPSNAGNDYMGVVWRSAVGDYAALKVDLGADVPIDTLMLFGVAGTLSGAAFAIAAATAAQGSSFAPGTFWQAIGLPALAGSELPVSGRGVTLWTRPATAGPPAAVRHLLIQFGGLGASGYVEIARVVVGARIELARNFSFGAAFGVRDFGSLDFSPRAVMLRRRSKKLRSVGLAFSNAHKDEVEAAINPLIEQVGGTEPIALITDPAEDAMRQRRCYFGPLIGDLGTVWRTAAAWEWRANMQSLI